MSPVSLQIAGISVDLLRTILVLAVILVATLIVAKVLGIIVYRTISKRSSKLARQTKRVVVWLTWFTGLSLGLYYLGLGLALPIIAIAIGVIIAIALRDVFLNLAAYEVITTYDPFKIGDWIQVGKVFGRVVDVTWIDTVLMTPNNEMVYIPNSTLTRSKVVNRTTEGGVRISISIQVEKSLDYSYVEASLLGIGEELREELATDSKPEVRLMSLERDWMRVALLLRINNPAKGKLLASEVRKRIKMKLDAARQ